MEEKFKMVEENETKEVETLEEKKEEVKEPNKENKHSVILIFSILGAVVFMLLVIASVFFLVPFINGKNKTTTKAGTDAKEVKSEYKMSGNSLEKFDLAFLKLENNGKNEIYSPLSIKYALAMLSEGSEGTTKNQIDAIIGEYKANKYPNNEHMSFANAMYIRNTFKDNLKESYTKTLADKYSAEVKLDDFSSAKNMNNWVSQKTFNLINDLFDDDTVSKENFELINALAIDMNWNNQIQCATGSDVPCMRYSIGYRHEKLKGSDYEYHDYVDTIYDDRNFHALAFNGKENIKSVTVKAAFNNYDAVKEIGKDKIKEEVGKAYKEWLETDDGKNGLLYGWAEPDVNKYLEKYIEELNENYGKEDNSTDFMIYTDDNVKVFAKDLKTYDDKTLQYVGIMPKNEELNKYIDNVTPEDINNIIKNLKTMNKENFKDGVLTLIHGYIPLFDYEYKLDLMNDLQTLGVKDVFDVNKANLSGMLKDSENQYINSASHKAKIEFSNDGIKAAAATQAGGSGATGGGFNYLYEVPVEEIDITFDKPFMYIIRDKDTGEVWFTGSVYEPKTK